MSSETDTGIDPSSFVNNPSPETIKVTQYICLAIYCLVFLHGCWNIVKYLIMESRWKAFPLLLMYSCAQLTLIFAIARLVWPTNPEYDIMGPYRVYLYLQTIAFSTMMCVGSAQILTLLELTLKTSSVIATMDT